MDKPTFVETTIEWAMPSTWIGAVGAWIAPRLRAGAFDHLSRRPRKRLYVDDSEWLDRVGRVSRHDLQGLVEDLVAALADASMVVFHGTRVDDPGCFAREGLLINNPARREEKVRELLLSEPRLSAMYDDPEAMFASFDKRERDIGNLFVVADRRTLLDGAGHYLLYGSEWMQVLLGWNAHPVLRDRGYPTVVRARLPLGDASAGDRAELAGKLLLEWARQMAERDGETPELDFSFCLRRDIPSDLILGHDHPSRIKDPFYNVTRINKKRRCSACLNNDG